MSNVTLLSPVTYIFTVATAVTTQSSQQAVHHLHSAQSHLDQTGDQQHREQRKMPGHHVWWRQTVLPKSSVGQVVSETMKMKEYIFTFPVPHCTAEQIITVSCQSRGELHVNDLWLIFQNSCQVSGLSWLSVGSWRTQRERM